jgi:hypothetical protein
MKLEINRRNGRAAAATPASTSRFASKSGEFLDVENHPEIVFASSRVESHGDRLRITGDPGIRGVTRTVVLDAEYAAARPNGNHSQRRHRRPPASTADPRPDEAGEEWTKGDRPGGDSG